MKLSPFIFYVGTLLAVKPYGILGKQSIDNALDEVYNIKQQDGWQRERSFIHKLWPEISTLIPESARVPRFQKRIPSSQGNNGYFSSYETAVYLRIGNIVSIDFAAENYQDDNGCVMAAVTAELHFSNPVPFRIYTGDSSGNIFPLVFVAYSFNGENKAIIWLRIPDFSKKRDEIAQECAIKIYSFAVDYLSDPTIDEGRLKDAEARKLANLFWESVREVHIYTMMSIGVINEVLNKNGALFYNSKSNTKPVWRVVCINNNFRKRAMIDYTFIMKDVGDEKKSTKINYIKICVDKSLTSMSAKPKRNVVMDDFMELQALKHADLPITSVDSMFFTMSPTVFRLLRAQFGITDDEFVAMFSRVPLRQLPNPGRRSSLYLSQNEYFIAKTMVLAEANFLQTFFSGYILNLYQNPGTLLPKYLGLFWYEDQSVADSQLPAMIVMNNVIPPNNRIDQRYDLKGTILERKASNMESKNHAPIFQDLDFIKHHPQGIYLRSDDYKKLMNIIQMDCLVLQGFEIFDYSLLLAIHYDDRPKGTIENKIPCEQSFYSKSGTSSNFKVQKINGNSKPISLAPLAFPAFTARGEKLTIYLGIIDILKSYREKVTLSRKDFFEGDFRIDPAYYAHRFEDFINENVFKMMPHCLERKPSAAAREMENKKRQDEEKIRLRTALDYLFQAPLDGKGYIVTKY